MAKMEYLDYANDRRPPWYLVKRLIYAGLIALAILSCCAGLLYRLMHHDYGKPITTVISCVDSVTGNALTGDADIPKDGGLDDDPDKEWSYGWSSGKLVVEHNVWVIVEIKVEGYQPVQIILDRNSPKTLIVKMKQQPSK